MGIFRLAVPLILANTGLVYGGLTPSAVTLNSSAPSSRLGAPVTLTARVSPAAATGKVTYYDGVTVLGVENLNSGSAALTTSLLPAGQHSLRAYYVGDTVYAASISATVAFPVNSIPGKSFLLPQSYLASSAVSETLCITIGDFNEDGKADLAMGNGYPGGVSILLGNGDGSFQPGVSYALELGEGPEVLVVGDFNGDGHSDLASLSVDGTVQILLGNGAGAFQAGYTTLVVNGASGPDYSLVAGDFNGDGNVDLAVAGVWGAAGGGVLAVLLGDGSGAFAESDFSLTGLPQAVAAGDFNGDGITDLAFAIVPFQSVQTNPAGTLVMLGNGNGTFTQDGFVAADPVQWIVAGDFNGDGKSDLAVFSTSGQLNVLLGNGSGGFRSSAQYYSAVSDFPYLAVGDFNGDGKSDLALFENGAMTLFLGNGDGTFQPSPSVMDERAQNLFVLADFNGDGRTDIAFNSSILVTNDGDSTSYGAADIFLAGAFGLYSSANPVFSQDTVTLTAIISSPGATGSVTFMDGSTSIGTAAVTGGTATLSVSRFTPGTHVLSSVYSGDSNNPPGASFQVTETVYAELVPGSPGTSNLTSNLLVNPGAENGLTGWWADNPLSAAVPASPPPGGSGSYSFYGGKAPNAFVSQTIPLYALDLSGANLNLLYSGQLLVNYSFWFADQNPGSGSYGLISVTFYDDNLNPVGQGTSYALLDNGTFQWSNTSGSFPIPPTTEYFVYTMGFINPVQSTNTGLIDDNVLTVSSVQ